MPTARVNGLLSLDDLRPATKAAEAKDLQLTVRGPCEFCDCLDQYPVTVNLTSTGNGSALPVPAVRARVCAGCGAFHAVPEGAAF